MVKKYNNSVQPIKKNTNQQFVEIMEFRVGDLVEALFTPDGKWYLRFRQSRMMN